MKIFRRSSVGSYQNLSPREPISANCYVVLVAMSTKFILENLACLGGGGYRRNKVVSSPSAGCDSDDGSLSERKKWINLLSPWFFSALTWRETFSLLYFHWGLRIKPLLPIPVFLNLSFNSSHPLGVYLKPMPTWRFVFACALGEKCMALL